VPVITVCLLQTKTIIIIIINKYKTRNYVENTCQTNFLFSKLLKYCS
jgi:hypothetical protein